MSAVAVGGNVEAILTVAENILLQAVASGAAVAKDPYQYVVQQMTQQQMQNPMGMQNPDGSFVRFDIPAFYIKEVMPLMGVKNGRSYLVTTSAQEIAQKAQLNAEMHQPAQGGAPAAPGRPGMPPQGPGAPRAALAHPGLPGVPQGPPAGPPPNGQPQVRLA